MAEKGTLRSYSVVLGGFIVYLTYGSIFSFGNLTTYLTSYLRARSHSGSIRYIESAWILALTFSSFGVLVIFGGLLSVRIGPRLTTLLGSAIMSVAVFATYFTVQWSFYACIFTYSIIFGAGIGLAYPSPMSCAMKWHPAHMGLVNGIALAGFGGGSLIFNQIQTAFINPDNKSPDLMEAPGSNEFYYSEQEAADVLDRVPQCFLLLGGVYIVMQLVGCLMLADPLQSEDKVESISLLECESHDKSVTYETVEKEEAGVTVKHVDFSPRQVLRCKAFYILWIMFMLSSQCMIIISSFYKVFGQTFIQNDHFLVTIGSCSALFNASGRVLWGVIVDRTSFRTAMSCLSMMFGLLCATFYVSAYIQSSVMYTIWVFMLYLSLSGITPVYAVAISNTYGPKYFSANLGLMISAQVITSPIGILFAGAAIDSLGWLSMFCILAGSSFTTAFLAICINLRGQDGMPL